MKDIKIKYCINEKIWVASNENKTQLAKKYRLSRQYFSELINFKRTMSYKTIKKNGFEDKFIEPVLWYAKEKRVVRFKDAKTEIEKQIIKIYEESKNETEN